MAANLTQQERQRPSDGSQSDSITGSKQQSRYPNETKNLASSGSTGSIQNALSAVSSSALPNSPTVGKGPKRKLDESSPISESASRHPKNSRTGTPSAEADSKIDQEKKFTPQNLSDAFNFFQPLIDELISGDPLHSSLLFSLRNYQSYKTALRAENLVICIHFLGKVTAQHKGRKLKNLKSALENLPEQLINVIDIVKKIESPEKSKFISMFLHGFGNLFLYPDFRPRLVDCNIYMSLHPLCIELLKQQSDAQAIANTLTTICKIAKRLPLGKADNFLSDSLCNIIPNLVASLAEKKRDTQSITDTLAAIGKIIELLPDGKLIHFLKEPLHNAIQGLLVKLSAAEFNAENTTKTLIAMQIFICAFPKQYSDKDHPIFAPLQKMLCDFMKDPNLSELEFGIALLAFAKIKPLFIDPIKIEGWLKQHYVRFQKQPKQRHNPHIIYQALMYFRHHHGLTLSPYIVNPITQDLEDTCALSAPPKVFRPHIIEEVKKLCEQQYLFLSIETKKQVGGFYIDVLCTLPNGRQFAIEIDNKRHLRTDKSYKSEDINRDKILEKCGIAHILRYSSEHNENRKIAAAILDELCMAVKDAPHIRAVKEEKTTTPIAPSPRAGSFLGASPPIATPNSVPTTSSNLPNPTR